MVEKTENEMEIMFKQCFQIYWLSILVSDSLSSVGCSLATDAAKSTRPLDEMAKNKNAGSSSESQSGIHQRNKHYD